MTALRRIKSLAPALKKRSQHTLNGDAEALLRMFAFAVKKRRAELGVSRTQVARSVGISYAQLAHVENAENWPTVPVYRALCRVLKCGRVPLL